jgi:FG-GAP-like repeat
MNTKFFFPIWFLSLPVIGAGSFPPKFRAVEIDTKIEIGYGVAVADVDGDGKPDILLADKKQFVWYRNPTWEKSVLAENLTKEDNVCIAAADVDGDGKCEIAVGAGWNPGDTVNSGAVFYLVAPKDRAGKWEAVELHHEPTVHRMRWVKNAAGRFDLVVVPLHGRGNKNAQGDGVKILAYKMPADVKRPWATETIEDTLHLTHNFQPVNWGKQTADELLVAGKEGVFHLFQKGTGWMRVQLAGNTPGQTNFTGAGEVRVGKSGDGKTFIATVEPMHGNQMVVYTAPLGNDQESLWHRHVVDDELVDGHALACADLLGLGSDQIVVGWRAMNKPGAKVGIKLFTPLDRGAKDWQSALIDDNTMACEDLTLADLNGDGKLDIVAAGRATKNVKIYFNECESGAK